MGVEDEDVVVDSPKLDLRNEHISSTDRPYDGWRGNRLSPAACTKVLLILDACREGCKGDHLGTLAASTDGLIDDEVRRVACTSMAGLEDT